MWKRKIIDKYGDYYVGQFKDSHQEGEGKIVYTSPHFYYLQDNMISYYEGSWKNGEENGYGCYSLNDNVQIKGHWNGKGLCRGKTIKFQKRIYESDFNLFQYDGKGKLIYKKGSYCEGE